jgi:hypothetical protein
MRDKERGVVWEETIILLPHKVLGLVRSVCMSGHSGAYGWCGNHPPRCWHKVRQAEQSGRTSPILMLVYIAHRIVLETIVIVPSSHD